MCSANRAQEWKVSGVSGTEAVAAGALVLLHALHPTLVPRVREVHEQDELHEDEEEAADQAHDHPRHVERAALDEERAHQEAEHEQQLDDPKPAHAAH